MIARNEKMDSWGQMRKLSTGGMSKKRTEISKQMSAWDKWECLSFTHFPCWSWPFYQIMNTNLKLPLNYKKILQCAFLNIPPFCMSLARQWFCQHLTKSLEDKCFHWARGIGTVFHPFSLPVPTCWSLNIDPDTKIAFHFLVCLSFCTSLFCTGLKAQGIA